MGDKHENPLKLFSTGPTDDGAKLKVMGDVIIGMFTKHTDNLCIWAVSAALHTIVHGDYTEIPRVEEKLSERGFRSNALKAWFTSKKVFGEAGAPLRWVAKTDTEKAHYELVPAARDALKARYEADKDAVCALLMATPYYKLTKEAEYQGDNLQADLSRLLKKYNGIAADEKKREHPKTNLKGLDSLRALVEGNAAGATAH